VRKAGPTFQQVSAGGLREEMISEGGSFQAVQTLESFILICRYYHHSGFAARSLHGLAERIFCVLNL
jgi:hypothetical protein